MRGLKAVFAVVAVVVLLLGAAGWFVTHTRSGQDWLLARTIPALFANQPVTSFDGLRVFLCGTASPLVAPGCAQSCVAVMAGDDLYIVDAGMSAAATFQFNGETLAPARALLLTHFHSDHITGIPDINLNSWVMGRRQPLRVLGPTGVERVVGGLNEAFALDYDYRVAHHGEALLPPELAPMAAETIAPGVVIEDDRLVVTAFPVDHRPVSPAVGYRFDYRGRSVVVSGDTVVTDSLRDAAQGADLLLHDVLSLPIVQALQAAAQAAGNRAAKIMADIPSYHALASELGALAESANVGQLAVYHFVPVPRNYLMEQIYRSELPSDAVMTVDGMVFELPGDSQEIDVHAP